MLVGCLGFDVGGFVYFMVCFLDCLFGILFRGLTGSCGVGLFLRQGDAY